MLSDLMDLFWRGEVIRSGGRWHYVSPERFWEFVTQNYWLFPTLDFWVGCNRRGGEVPNFFW